VRKNERRRYYEQEHERIFRETGVPNPMIRGEIGASVYAYPNGLWTQRAGRWIVRHVRRLRNLFSP
jgi:hypothetical protein